MGCPNTRDVVFCDKHKSPNRVATMKNSEVAEVVWRKDGFHSGFMLISALLGRDLFNESTASNRVCKIVTSSIQSERGTRCFQLITHDEIASILFPAHILTSFRRRRSILVPRLATTFVHHALIERGKLSSMSR